MKRPTPISLTVRSSDLLTPNMQRLTLQGDGLQKYPDECRGGYVKLLFNANGSTDLAAIPEGERPVMRTYTIRDFDRLTNLITIDFVRHEVKDCSCGFASRWAMNSQIGDSIKISGPGLSKNINQQVDWLFFVADMTALPALSVQLEQLDADAKGYAVIEVASQDDIQTLKMPEGIQCIWVDKSSTSLSLSDSVKSLVWHEGTAAVWCACEFDSMRALRTYFHHDKDVERDNLYISSYWKEGVTEEGHKVIKRAAAKQDEESEA
ncbi:NADPH-dependent ferric siderophore reductase [Vibrio sp. 10N.286.49.B3]|uniref:siderophore-interacting protein n=1 Tax=Vibrio sp. 10N.286.49.B3 TaxID=1880855 RepID=UPI000C81830E|nr:siderophore-interacting protein [Vibrio sp. 10N.286.49.B3]PMH46138.1 NADPH-dependent ferric siderophore reductase [Vibrio sp. 10N.286.49.B3]